MQRCERRHVRQPNCVGATPPNTSCGRAPPGCGPRPPEAPHANPAPGSAQTASRACRRSGCSRPPPHPPTAPSLGPGSTDRRGDPARPVAGLPRPEDRAQPVPRPLAVPQATCRKSRGPMDTMRHGRLCQGAHNFCRGPPTPATEAAGLSRRAGCGVRRAPAPSPMSWRSGKTPCPPLGWAGP